MVPSHTVQNNVINLPRRYGCSPPPDFDADGGYHTGQTRIRDRWFGIPAVEEKVIYERGKVPWHRIRPPDRPISPLCAAAYLSFPVIWVAAGVGLWWLL